MPSVYLQPSEYATYGLESTVSTSDIVNACAVVDSYIQRPEGLVWMPDSRGLPCYMAALQPSFSATLPVALSAGQPATFTFPLAGTGTSSLIGEVLIVDRGDNTKVEALVITGTNAQAGTITVAAPANAHAIAATLEMGLVVVEERPLAAKRSQTRVSRTPVMRLHSGVGRYAYGRRSDQVAGLYNDVNLLAAVQTFGGPPQWIPFDVRSADIRPTTGEVWVPAGLMLAYYTDVCLRYIAGYPQAGLPATLKQAVANIVINAGADEYAPPSLKIVQAGGTKFERWSDNRLDSDTKNLLEPFRQKLMF
ncbi:hypothetical protein J2792_002339 [Novosphingobium capsulatum]|uniref:Tail protein n=1 Tax=Novosphingobium capsulatum TaxID=13688 RepID=A0ABU1MMG8_9SPHN|nr:hypothetical protein [Novosphingobium capsulatum]MDR6511467.1 hypothetical protein [Novosphingobium capsulatum]